ncbi:MAG: hypothetical protein DSZ10_05260 [Sulfurovum sp.]|nr:MAG: hypothetical protein DSZ10_05260 [Sulfurovum sp.]
MYYITNQNGEIIAADLALMDLVGAKNIGDLYKYIALGELDFQLLSESSLQVSQSHQSTQYPIQQSKLSSILGEITIVHIVQDAHEHAPEAARPSPAALEINDVEPLVAIEQDKISLSTAKEETEFDLENLLKEAEDDMPPKEQEETGESSQPSDLLYAQEEKNEAQAPDTDDELFDLLLPKEATESIEEIVEIPESPEIQEASESLRPTLTQKDENAPILIDIQTISQEIGIDPDDYIAFLDEYIDTAIQLENDLLSPDAQIRNTAIKTLSHLGDVLHLPKVNKIIKAIGGTEEVQERHSRITLFYNTLSRLTTKQEHDDTLTTEQPTNNISDLSSVGITGEAIDTQTDGFGTIDLSEINPIYFDFQLEEAANDLGLPTELIEEFVHDFITQATEETPKMLEAYQKGDLETIQKIGHLLKGAASNLRITPLADTLYEIQMCNDSSQLERLIKNYWAHFLSLENKMNISSK